MENEESNAGENQEQAENNEETAQPKRDLDPITVLQEELVAMQDKYLRTLADLDNTSKRALKERSELVKYQGEKIFVDLLDVVDDFERALQFSDKSTPEQFLQGVGFIHKKFLDVLAKWNVKSESTKGQLFDPAKCQALANSPATDGVEPGTVIEEYKKAFWYKDKLIRVGEVIVATEKVIEN